MRRRVEFQSADLAAGPQSRPEIEKMAGSRVRRKPLRQTAHPSGGITVKPKTAPRGENSTAGLVAEPGLSFHRILVPIDFSAESTRALKTAAALTSSAGGILMLVHVVGPIYDLRDFGYGSVQRRRPNEGLMRHARQRLKALGRRHVGDKRDWRCTVRSGTAPRQILKAAEDFDADLVVMPTRGLSHAPPEEMGSTAERVVRHAPCPVLVLPHKPRAHAKKA